MRVSVRPFGKGGEEGVVTAPGEQVELFPWTGRTCGRVIPELPVPCPGAGFPARIVSGEHGPGLPPAPGEDLLPGLFRIDGNYPSSPVSAL